MSGCSFSGWVGSTRLSKLCSAVSRPKRFHELTPEVQFQLIKKRLGEYSRKAYKKTHNTKEVKVWGSDRHPPPSTKQCR